MTIALNNLFGWARNRPPAKPSWPRGLFWSSISGVTSFLAHAGSPPIMAYLLPLRLDKPVYIGMTVWFFFASNYAKIVPYAFLGQLDVSNLATALVLLPLVPIGVRLGVLALLGIGIKLVYDGLTSL